MLTTQILQFIIFGFAVHARMSEFILTHLTIIVVLENTKHNDNFIITFKLFWCKCCIITNTKMQNSLFTKRLNTIIVYPSVGKLGWACIPATREILIVKFHLNSLQQFSKTAYKHGSEVKLVHYSSVR